MSPARIDLVVSYDTLQVVKGEKYEGRVGAACMYEGWTSSTSRSSVG